MVEKSRTENENITTTISFADLRFHATFKNKLDTGEINETGRKSLIITVWFINL